MQELNVILVPLALIAGAFVILGMDLLFRKGAPPALLELLSYASVIVPFVLIILRIWRNSPDLSAYHDAVTVDAFGTFMSIPILVATGLALMLATNTATRFRVELPEYLALLLLSAAGMLFLVMSKDLVTLFLSLEIMSLALYVLTGVTRHEARSSEAAVKYFIMGSVASAFLAYGMVLLYGVTGSIQLSDIGQKLSSGAVGGVGLAGVGMLLVGFAFKIGAVPFHMWVPDVYEGAPTAVTAFMSVAVKAAAFAALIRTVVQFRAPLVESGSTLLQAVAIATMIVGNLLAVSQTSVKRMLAYSSIAHSGYALIGVIVAAASETDRRDGVTGTAFYLLAYTFMTLGAFASLIFAGSKDRDAESLDDFQGLARTRPVAALLMSVFMLSLAGIPPMGGFFGKFFLFRVALKSDHVALVIVAILTTLLSVYYYLRVVVYMYMKPAPVRGPSMEPDGAVGAALAVAAIFTVVLGVVPDQFLRLAIDLVPRLCGPG